MPADSPKEPSPNIPARPTTVEGTFRVYDAPIILLGLLLAAGLALPLTRNGLIPQTLSWMLMMTAVAEGLVIGGIFWLARRRQVSLRNLVLGASSRWPIEVFWGLVLALVLFTIMIILWLLQVPVSDPLEQVVGHAPLAVKLVFLVLAVVLAPISEELLYRGVLQSSLVPRIGLVMACLVQAALFGLMHQRGWVVILAVFGGGLAYGALVLWRGCLLPSIVVHASLNGLIAGWLLALFWINAHLPAATMIEAQQKPLWWDEPPMLTIPQKETAQEQHEVALRRFGSLGLQLRKDQIKAFNTVRHQFPKNTEYGARSLVGIQEVYLRYLSDPRRAIVTGEQLLEEYSDQRSSQAEAMFRIAEAYLKLNQFDKAHQWIERVETEYGDIKGIQNRVVAFRDALESQALEGR